MDFLCFTIGTNNYAIQIEMLQAIINNFSLTHLINEEQKPIFMISYLDKLINVYSVDDEFNNENKLILILNYNNKIFGVFIDGVTKIVRHEIPDGYWLIDADEVERMIIAGHDDKVSDIELF